MSSMSNSTSQVSLMAKEQQDSINKLARDLKEEQKQLENPYATVPAKQMKPLGLVNTSSTPLLDKAKIAPIQI